jgi:ABC-type transporter Mla MlaB component
MGVMITTVSSSNGTVVHIAGRLEAADLPELVRTLEGHDAPIELELSQLSTADADGLSFLRAREADGCTLSGVSPYVDLLLGDPPGGRTRLPSSSPE